MSMLTLFFSLSVYASIYIKQPTCDRLGLLRCVINKKNTLFLKTIYVNISFKQKRFILQFVHLVYLLNY